MKKPFLFTAIIIAIVAFILFIAKRSSNINVDKIEKTDSIIRFKQVPVSYDTPASQPSQPPPDIIPIKPSKPKYEDPVLGAEPDYNSYSDQMQAISAKVAYQAEQQFFIAKRQGDLMQIYVQAQMVCAAYLQARDEVNYNKWKVVEKHYQHKIGL